MRNLALCSHHNNCTWGIVTRAAKMSLGSAVLGIRSSGSRLRSLFWGRSNAVIVFWLLNGVRNFYFCVPDVATRGSFLLSLLFFKVSDCTKLGLVNSGRVRDRLSESDFCVRCSFPLKVGLGVFWPPPAFRGACLVFIYFIVCEGGRSRMCIYVRVSPFVWGVIYSL